MTGVVHWIDTEGGERSERSDTPPTRESLRLFVQGDIEYVWVLFKGRRTCMVVNETGRLRSEGRDPLPVNLAASKIYAAASHRDSRYAVPEIHGNAVVLENIQLD